MVSLSNHGAQAIARHASPSAYVEIASSLAMTWWNSKSEIINGEALLSFIKKRLNNSEKSEIRNQVVFLATCNSQWKIKLSPVLCGCCRN